MHSAPDLPGLLSTNLNLAPDTAASIYSRPRLETAHRTSLMSTGSSDSGTGSNSDQDQPLLSPASGQFSWPGPSGSYRRQRLHLFKTIHCLYDQILQR